MTLNIFFEGQSFDQSGGELKAIIKPLEGYYNIFNSCLNKSLEKHSSEKFPEIRAKFKLTSIKTGSLDFNTAIDLLVVGAPLLQSQIPQAADTIKYVWSLFSSAKEFIEIVSTRFNKTGTPININLTNSPNAKVILATDNSSVQVSMDIYEIAKQHHSDFEKIAYPVKCNMASKIKVSSNNDFSSPKTTSFDNSNFALFSLPHSEHIDTNEYTIPCYIYRLNKRRMTGQLEILIDETHENVPFDIIGGEINDYIDAMKSQHSIATVIAEKTINAIGESRVKKLRILSIVNINTPYNSVG
jgi:hypothetical protein